MKNIFLIPLFALVVLTGCTKKTTKTHSTTVTVSNPTVISIQNETDLFIVDTTLEISGAIEVETKVYFEKGKYEVFSERISGFSGKNVIVFGYASNERNESKGWPDHEEARYNAFLSEKRANSVCKALIKGGAKLCDSRGMGETDGFGTLEENRIALFKAQ